MYICTIDTYLLWRYISLSMYIYTYIYMHIHRCMYIDIYIYNVIYVLLIQTFAVSEYIR